MGAWACCVNVLEVVERLLALLSVEPVQQRFWVVDEQAVRIRGGEPEYPARTAIQPGRANPNRQLSVPRQTRISGACRDGVAPSPAPPPIPQWDPSGAAAGATPPRHPLIRGPMGSQRIADQGQHLAEAGRPGRLDLDRRVQVDETLGAVGRAHLEVEHGLAPVIEGLVSAEATAALRV